MKIVVIEGSGLIGTKVVNQLRQADHIVIAALPATGINTIKPTYFGGEVPDSALVPAGEAQVGTINLEKWWSTQAVKA
ncbi:hypothetical protein SAMN05518672_103585 [Chitinophaga sp. CF118]|uniref:hypothetical protein n=1 Tax=Chitinophaga sp. CF118 TaxID=1884367 RepID=UPI0008E254CD|nr:hypothetical protein [Chitinophaga sp. CF118]SFD86572.1 hypothetical protein SAMN05518672_103585 [Chitinophaga sp. CF118]